MAQLMDPKRMSSDQLNEELAQLESRVAANDPAQVLNDVIAGKLPVGSVGVDADDSELAQLRAQLDAARAENAALKATAKTGTAARAATIRLSAKGAVVVEIAEDGYPMWPVTLYYNEWAKLLAQAPAIADFLNANKSSILAHRPGKAS